ncbi:elongation factor G [Aestuariirhabdus sp. Z084]|uniref:elongation factor G n=1 Tax=Aestuariirhabdus haliotis TaxID=2918751 RepID=UPI00201B42CB|nr:elongation factor G [Aestuariirhabdus haliotis]MCL6417740.1 elongation factor G [Aestuariirhabdus haliotis]MCL6421679.1 elongation factor G [Aestuariirhabdus haliotis]
MDRSHYPLQQIRNIGFIAHIDAGKTTLSERILFYSGFTHQMGNVDAGNTVTDWMEQERERGITIVSAAISTSWRQHQLNIIDTPGHIDFTAEVERALRILDGGVVLIDAVKGIEPQSETVWHQAELHHVPRLCFINKMDRTGADFEASLDSFRQRLNSEPLPIQLPIQDEQGFHGVIDLVGQRALYWQDALGSEMITTAVPELMQAACDNARTALIERVAEEDETLLERYLANQSITEAELKAAIRRGTLANRLFPLLCGACLRNLGVQPLLDAIVDYLPSPADIGEVEGTHPKQNERIRLPASSDAPLAALVFKVVSDSYAGHMAYVRVYSGTLKAGQKVWIPGRQREARIGRMVRVYADRRENIDEIPAGEIDAIVGLKGAFTGDTLCDPKHPILLETIEFPEPVVNIALEPATPKDRDAISQALANLAEEDPTFHVHTDEDTGQTLLSGMGELHLEVLVNRLQREHSVAVRTGRPKVSYKETIVEPIKGIRGRLIHQSGGHGQYGDVTLDVQPGERGSGVQFQSRIKGGLIPNEFIPAVEKGIRDGVSCGLIGGHDITDISVALVSGSSHEVDSSEQAFRSAATIALNRAIHEAGPRLLEPIFKLEVSLPDDNLGDLLGLLAQIRCRVEDTRGTSSRLQTVRGLVPLAEMFGFATRLRSLSHGRGLFSMRFDHFALVPISVQQQLEPLL